MSFFFFFSREKMVMVYVRHTEHKDTFVFCFREAGGGGGRAQKRRKKKMKKTKEKQRENKLSTPTAEIKGHFFLIDKKKTPKKKRPFILNFEPKILKNPIKKDTKKIGLLFRRLR